MGIAEKLTELLDPFCAHRRLLVSAWRRSIDVFWQTAAPPDRAWIPPQDVAPYHGRG
jgi:7-cyano-7-deazaguanine reductase